MRRIAAILIVGVLTLPMGHGLGELFHDHDSESAHCHIAQHHCSEEALTSACHLSIYHGQKSACSDHDHFSQEESKCEICLWSESHRIQTLSDDPLEIKLLPISDAEVIWYISRLLERNSSAVFLRGPPLFVG
ncbi:MAG: hypothetical protein HKN45_12525 [Flavobacteriales bacterium]|nr:hypothetical protein [Flavobacteriales bacterium]